LYGVGNVKLNKNAFDQKYTTFKLKPFFVIVLYKILPIGVDEDSTFA